MTLAASITDYRPNAPGKHTKSRCRGREINSVSRHGIWGGRSLSHDTLENKAKTAYQDFFAIWKDADPDVPILKQAKAEYANLN
jgi:hypothetical protein